MMKTPETDDIFRVLPFCAGTMQKFKSQQVCVCIPSLITINHDSLKLNSCRITHCKQMKYNYTQSNQVHPLQIASKMNLAFIN